LIPKFTLKLESEPRRGGFILPRLDLPIIRRISFCVLESVNQLGIYLKTMVCELIYPFTLLPPIEYKPLETFIKYCSIVS